MQAQKSFTVFGDPVNVLVNSAETQKSFSIVTQVCQPGGGPPPHTHTHEDEIFTVVHGEWEVFDGKSWTRIAPGESAYTLRGNVHTFRNCGDTVGTLMATVIPGTGFEDYLEAISPLQMPADMPALMEISDRYGITFATPEVPTDAPL